MKIKDRFWLWGHPEGRYNNEFGNKRVSRMTPMEACSYLGVNNVFMVPVGVVFTVAVARILYKKGVL